MIKKLLPFMVLSLLPISAAQADHHGKTAIGIASVAGAEALVDDMGKTLYVFDKDKAGMSNCYQQCAQKWPPLLAEKAVKKIGHFSVIQRKDKSYQWAYKDKPLYRWIKDQKKGDNSGDGVKGVWHTARP